MRKRFEPSRYGITKKRQVGGMQFYVIVNFYADTHEPGEVFAIVAKQGSTVAGMVDAWVTTISIALQHGVPWERLRDKYVGHVFDPQDTPTYEDGKRVGFTSLVDAIAKTIDEAVTENKSVWAGVDSKIKTDENCSRDSHEE